jgi:hypothetical protein
VVNFLYFLVSAFANSGGGTFIAGVNNKGKIDGGIESMIGRQTLYDWTEQVINEVKPTPKYNIQINNDHKDLENNKAILVINIEECVYPPYMALDNKFYIRAGTHTAPANQFIVDVLYEKRGSSNPILRYNFRFKPNETNIIQLGILNLSKAPAFEVFVNLSPLGEFFNPTKDKFPFKIPIITPSEPFYFDVGSFQRRNELFGESVSLELNYKDLTNKKFTYKANLEISKCLPPTIFKDIPKEIKIEALDKIIDVLSEIKELITKDNKTI